jgi:adenylate kinase
VPDDVTIQLVRDEVTKSDVGFILDGFPRTLPQAEALDELLEGLDRQLSIVLLLALDDTLARERLMKRAQLEGRADDRPEAIDARLATYHRETEPVVDHYRATGKLVQLHGDRPMEDVWREISDALGQVEARA